MKPNKYLLGQVGGFPLRLSWLPRVYAQYEKDKAIPCDPEKIATDLGIGKNMVKSLRVWGLASGVLGEKGEFMPLAHGLFKRDPYFESAESMALLHWSICSNLKHFTANTWLFNYFNVGQFTVKQAVKQFREFLTALGVNYAGGTVRVDIETALRMYTSITERSSSNMDDKFLFPLGFFSARRIDGKSTFARTWETEKPLVSSRILAYAVLTTLAIRNINKSTLSDLYYSSSTHSAPGVVFGYTKGGFYSAVERIVNADSKNFTMTSLPGGDFQLAVSSRLSGMCKLGNLTFAEKHCFTDRK